MSPRTFLDAAAATRGLFAVVVGSSDQVAG